MMPTPLHSQFVIIPRLAKVLAALCLSIGTANLQAQSAAPAASSTTSPAKVHQWTLPNGLSLWVQVDKRAPTAVHMLWVRAGSMDEVDGTSGVAHVLEHMMFKGSAKLKPGEFSRRVAALGGRENAFTSRDQTAYFQQVPSANLKQVIDLEADRFANNRWSDEEFTREMAVIKEERRLRTDDVPRAQLFELLSAQAFLASPYRRPIVGWMNDLEHMRPADVRQFYRQWYTPSNAAVIVVGDVDPAQVKQWVEKAYGRIPARAVPMRKPRQEPPQNGLRRFEHTSTNLQRMVMMAYKMPHIQTAAQLDSPDEAAKDALALLVLSQVMSGHDGARLPRLLTQGENPVADSVDMDTGLTGRGPQLAMIAGVLRPQTTPLAFEAAVQKALQEVIDQGVSDAELSRVKNQWRASMVFKKDSMMATARELGSLWTLQLPADTDDRLLKLVQQITSQDLQRVAKRYLVDSAATIGHLLPASAPSRDSPALTTSPSAQPAR